METGNEWSDEEIDIYDNLSDENCNQQETSQEAEQTSDPFENESSSESIQGHFTKKKPKVIIPCKFVKEHSLGSRLYQESLTDVVNEGNIVLYSEVKFYCRVANCKKRVWTKIPIGSRDQIYDRETVEGHNHRPEPLQAEVDVVVDKALQLAKQSPLATNRSIIAAVLANQFRRSDMQMSLMNVAQAAYSARWNRPVAASRGNIMCFSNDLHQPAVAVNGVCQKPTRRRKRVIQSGPSPPSSGNLSQERIPG
uniref:FLYWCH-type domain-containing protein n=1 Tax=Ditylenchus dipsaci TaxID=166011 RepID=A0A915E5V2_9BILA